MKNILITIALLLANFYSLAQFRIRNDEFIQIGYDDYRTLSFGEGPLGAFPNNGEFALEYWNGGFNLWKPWGSTNPANYLFFVRNDHNIGIGHQGSPQYKLDIIGDAKATGFWVPSDEKYKSELKPLNKSLDKVLKLKGYNYFLDMSLLVNNNYGSDDLDKFSKEKSGLNSSEAKTDDKSFHVGLVAQSVKEIMPEVVREDENGNLSMNYIEIIPYLIESIKEQQKQIDRLTKAFDK